ncbi:hypothetical protein F3Y22_tig00110450pilonHSYRG01080 [Hibiscus syriacus]|uniref:GIR1-like zinc ribbon domain-containing protein n=1 Tax=Hibiscus syriacus TaxID=106335 RepID=A0A6A3AJ66_HIBSY|nr:hypothetical protein F3Y22_tig00110450pilonHSYRG01080 [Hibiscus syriacus]
MSRRNGVKLELKLKLSPPRLNPIMESSPASRSATVSPTSPPSSCLSSDIDMVTMSSPETETQSMVLVGCPRCLMYVMLPEDNPKCPKCKSTVLLDFLHYTATTNSTTIKARKS